MLNIDEMEEFDEDEFDEDEEFEDEAGVLNSFGGGKKKRRRRRAASRQRAIDAGELEAWEARDRKRKKKKSWFGKALGTAGKVVTAPARVVKPIAKPVNKLGRKIKKVPVVGQTIGGVYSATIATPINTAKDIANGKRIDKVAYRHLKREVKNFQDLAPAAQMTAQLVPGVGFGISGAIGAANALSKGRRIDKAFVEGVKGAIPGGPFLQAGFNLVSDIKAKKRPSRIQIRTEGGGSLSADFTTNVEAALDGDLSAAAKVNAEMKKIPKAEREGLQTGMALATAADLQKKHERGAGSAGAIILIYKAGRAEQKKDPVLRKLNPNKIGLKSKNAKFGFAVGIGAMTFKQNATSLKATFKKIKRTKGRQGEIGFYLGVAYHIGKTTREPLPEGSAYQQFAYYVAEGLKGDTNIRRKKAILKLIAPLQESKEVVRRVLQESTPEDLSWWDKLVDWLSTPF